MEKKKKKEKEKKIKGQKKNNICKQFNLLIITFTSKWKKKKKEKEKQINGQSKKEIEDFIQAKLRIITWETDCQRALKTIWKR